MADCDVFAIIILSAQGSHILTDCRSSKPIVMHILDSDFVQQQEEQLDYCSSSRYQAWVCPLFGIKDKSIVIRQHACYGDEFLHVTVLEMSEGMGCVSDGYQWTEYCGFEQLDEKVPQEVVQLMNEIVPNKKCEPDLMFKTRPWLYVGYFSRVYPWIKKSISEAGHKLTEMPKQLRTTDNATIFLVPTESEQFYFKSCRCGGDEPRKMQTMSNIFPEHTDRVLNINEECESILMYEHAESEDIDPCDIMAQWAAIQQRSMDHVAELKSGKFPVFDADWMRNGLHRLIEYANTTTHSDTAGIATRLKDAPSFLDTAASMWEQSGIPCTLVHGDMHSGNVARSKDDTDNLIFFDWDWTFIGWPFLELRDPTYAQLFYHESAYLKCWSSFADKETISKLATHTKPLVNLVCALLEYNGDRQDEPKKAEVFCYLRDFVDDITRMKQA